MVKEKTVMLNEKKLTWIKFIELKEKEEKKLGVKIIEISPGVYKTRVQG